MYRLFSTLIASYPADYRAEFGAEMRDVFRAIDDSPRPGSRLERCRFAVEEVIGLLRGALSEHCRRLVLRPAIPMVGGALLAFGMHLLMYWSLLPGIRKALQKTAEHFALPACCCV
jgi:hypothetical protein